LLTTQQCRRLDFVLLIRQTPTERRRMKYVSFLNVLLVVAAAIGFALYWPLQRELTAVKMEERQIRNDYSLYPLTDKELELYHFQFKPAAEAVHPVLDSKFVKSYRWSIRAPDQGFKFGDGFSGGGGELGHIDLLVTFIVRPEAATVFRGHGHSYTGGTISSDQKFNEFLIANWHRLDTEVLAEHENVTSNLESPRALLKLGFSKDLLAELKSVSPESADEYANQPFYSLEIKNPNQSESATTAGEGDASE